MNRSILIGAMIDIARKDFYYYCKFRMPQVYTDKRPHLKQLCNELQWFIEQDKKNNLIINLPPRFGKTLTVELLTEWIFGKDPLITVMTACYNETLSSRFSKAVRGGISEKPAKLTKPVFSDYFPGVKIKDGDAAMQLWALDGSHFSFLATSPGGTATGFGCKLMIIDDLIKNAIESYNSRILEEHYQWYSDTILSRLETGAKQIIIMTRWATGDLTGRLLEKEPEKWHVIKMKAQNDDGSMLCDDILSKESFEEKKSKSSPIIISGNYQQEPYDSFDKLYGTFKTYDPGLLPVDGSVESYTDTADEGSDYLCSIVYSVKNSTAYIIDIVYTQEPMEVTEGRVALMLSDNKCKIAHIESNNGGKGFARNVERVLRESAKYTSCRFKWFHQSSNKIARINSLSNNVTNSIIFPVGWDKKWPEFHRHVTKAGRQEKWIHDDALDTLTGIIEKSIESSKVSVASKGIRNALGYN